MTDKRYEYTIYKICSDECGEFYIGSTRNMVQRKKNHKSSCNNPNSKGYNQKTYRTIRDNGGWDEFRMVPLELMENTTKFEAECREEVVRCELQAKMNSIRANCGMTREEYRKKYNEEHKEHRKLYREEHKEHYKELSKIYREEHKEQIRDSKKIYREEHKEQIKLQRREKIECNCGSKFNQGDRARHIRTKKHQLYLENET